MSSNLTRTINTLNEDQIPVVQKGIGGIARLSLGTTTIGYTILLPVAQQTNKLTLNARRYIASGQRGHNSDVLVWSFEERSILFRLSEHDHGVVFVDFSHDDRLLCSGGGPEDKKILVWDMSNGCIVAIAHQDPASFTVAAWGGMVRYAPKYKASFIASTNKGCCAPHLHPSGFYPLQ